MPWVDDVYITGNPLCPGIDKMAETENGETISIIGAKYFPFPIQFILQYNGMVSKLLYYNMIIPIHHESNLFKSN